MGLLAAARSLGFAVLVGGLLAAGGPAAAAGEEESIFDGVQEHVLKNGLKLLVLEKHNAPVVTTMVWYRAGSSDETVKGRTGIAHFTEHMMFKGTRSIAKGEIDAITLKRGGANNAFTSEDATAYYFNFASDRWEIALSIEADRMRNCAFVQKEFDAEKQVVIEELRRSLDDPWGRLDMECGRRAFAGTTYEHPVLGWQKDLEAVTRADMLKYYTPRYAPNNATIVVVGDVHAPKVIALVRQLFAGMPRVNLPARPAPEAAPPAAAQRFTLEQETNTARVSVLVPTCRVGEPDDFALDILSGVLAGGKSSRLHQRLVEKDQTATFVHTTNDARRGPGVFWLQAEARPGVDPMRIEEAVWEELARLEREGVAPREIAKVVHQIIAAEAHQQEITQGLANALGQREAVAGSWHYARDYVQNVSAVTAADVARVLSRYFRPDRAVTGWSVPKPADNPGGPDEGDGGG
ncbi:MAG: insulinase family protein, partial [Planctomycetes bacterium]|nr:insulinase family protein [Planctomycetota bacterium]